MAKIGKSVKVVKKKASKKAASSIAVFGVLRARSPKYEDTKAKTPPGMAVLREAVLPEAALRPAFDSFKTSKLIQNGGKVDKAALFRQARDAAAAAHAAMRPTCLPPLPAIDQPTSPPVLPVTLTDEQEISREMLLPGAAATAAKTFPGGMITDDATDDDAPLLLPQTPREAGTPVSPLAPQVVTFHLTKNLDKRLDKYLCDRITFMSRNQLQQLIEDGQVTVNGRLGKNSTKLKKNDMVTVCVPPPPAEHIAPENIPLDVLFEDDGILVINKTPDIIVHPARAEKGGTMVNAVAWHLMHNSKKGGHLSAVGNEFARPGVVHRLDRQTSGVIIFAKSDEAHWKLAGQFERRTTDKRYVAVVHGHVEPLMDVIDEPLGPHQSREKGYREMHVVRHDHLGKQSVTIYRVLGRYTVPELDTVSAEGASPLGHRKHGGKLSLIEVELKTGRTHQIRVHMQHRGHPLLADDMYGGSVLVLPGKKKNEPGTPLVSRVALHAAMLSVRHPLSNDPATFIAPLQRDLLELIGRLRKLPNAFEPESPAGAMVSIAGLLGEKTES